MTRFHVTVFSGGRPVQHGWWPEEPTARRKFRDWIGSQMPNSRVTLAEKADGVEQLLDSWPDVPEGQSADG